MSSDMEGLGSILNELRMRLVAHINVFGSKGLDEGAAECVTTGKEKHAQSISQFLVDQERRQFLKCSEFKR